MSLNRRLRSTLAGVLVVDTAVLAVVLGLLTQRPVARAAITVIAIVVSLGLFALLSPHSVRHVRSEQKANRYSFLASFAACLLCTTMFTTALGFSRSVSDGVSEAVSSELGAVDVLIAAPNVASLNAAQATVRDLSDSSELASLFDSEPLTMRTISGAILTDGSPAPVRLIEVSTVEAAGFGRSPQTSGVAGIELRSGEALLSQKVADLLGAKRNDSVRIRMVGGGGVDLKLKAIVPLVGLVGLPMPDGRMTTNVIVGPGTLVSVPDNQTQYLLALSLCGGPSSRVLSNGVHTQCSTDPVESNRYVKRVDGELARAFGTLAAAVDDDALFAEEVDPATLESGLSISPIKLRVIESANRDHLAVQRVLDLSMLPLGLCALLGLIGVALISRSRRIRRDKLVGINSARSVGEQGLVVAFSSFPAVVLGSILGVLIVQIGVVISGLMSQGRSTTATSLLLAPSVFQLFADGLAASLSTTIFAALFFAWWANRTQQTLAMSSGQRSAKALRVSALFGFVGLLLVAVLVNAIAGRNDAAGVNTGTRSPLLLMVAALFLGSLCWLVIARGSQVGTVVAGVALPPSERTLLKLLRSRSARRPGLWELAAAVLLSFSLGTTAVLAGFLGTSAAAMAQIVESPFVEVNDVFSNIDNSASSPVEVDGSGQVIETRTMNGRGLLISRDPVSDRSLSTAAIREFSVGRLPESNARIVLQAFGVRDTPGVDQVVAGRAEFNRVFGSFPRPGDTVRIEGPTGMVPLKISSVAEGTSNALWVNESTWEELAPTIWFNHRLITPSQGQSVKETRRDLKAALRGRAVTIPDQVTTASRARSDAATLSLLGRWVGLFLGTGALCALMIRWSTARRKELGQLRLSMISSATVTRSISRDLFGQIFSASVAGMMFGGGLSLLLTRFGDLASSTPLSSSGATKNVGWVYLLVAAGLFVAAAFLSARFGSGGSGGSGGGNRNVAQADEVISTAEFEAATA